MKRRLTEPFGKAGLTVAVIALVMALVGGAYAAGGLTKSQEKQVKKIAKKYAGKPGAPGAPGASGTKGDPGTPGASGSPGASVTATEFEEEAGPCAEGGSEFKAATGTTYACNGKNGKTGFTETLPSGKTEKGDWVLAGTAAGEFQHFGAPVSFNIPLSTAPTAHYIRTTGMEPFWDAAAEEEKERTQSACPGNAAEPKATTGNLCVYASAEENTQKSFEFLETRVLPTICSLASPQKAPVFESYALGCLTSAPTADKTGFAVYTASKEANPVFVAGTWAVTG
jgi:hypothetical protein